MSYPYGTPVVRVGGIARLTPNGPVLMETADHAAVGVSEVVIYGPHLQMKFTQKGAVVSANVTADDALTSRGILAGVYGGVRHVTVTFYDTRINRQLNLSNQSDYDRAASWESNIWVDVVHIKQGC